MKTINAIQLAALLMAHPEAEICVGHEEQGRFGTGTPFTDDVIEPVRDIRFDDGKIVLTSSCFLYTGARIWTSN